MNSLRLAGLLLLALSHAAAAQTPAQPHARQSRDVAELTELVHEECEGVIENHAPALARILADEFVMHTVDGHVVPKAQFQSYLRAQLPPRIRGLCEIKDLSVEVSGRKATTEGRMQLRAEQLAGTPVPLQFKFRQKLVRRDHRWQATYIEFTLDQP